MKHLYVRFQWFALYSGQVPLGCCNTAKHVSGMDRELPSGALGDEACAALTAKILAVQPRLLAFTSLTGGRRWLGRAAGFGDSGARICETRVWLLPSFADGGLELRLNAGVGRRARRQACAMKRRRQWLCHRSSKASRAVVFARAARSNLP